MTMTQRDDDELIPINSLAEIPRFRTEDEEHEFWSTHSLGEALLDQMGPVEDGSLPPPRPRTRPIAVRFDDDTIGRLRQVAQLKGKGYQTLLKEFVVERLYEEEKRAGLVG
jgi:hypothetical protein